MSGTRSSCSVSAPNAASSDGETGNVTTAADRAHPAAAHRGPAGIRTVLVSALLLLLGHQLMYTYLAPFAGQAGFGDIGLVLFAFGGATVAGIWVVGAGPWIHARIGGIARSGGCNTGGGCLAGLIRGAARW